MSIDSLYKNAVGKLTAQNRILPISKQLLSMKSNDERVLFTFEILESLNAYPKFLDVTKSVEVSTHYRNLGNLCFQKFDNYRAWQFYNLALLYAPEDSESYALALSNRSAVFFSLKEFTACLNDIVIVFLNCPVKLMEKLNKRKNECQEKLSQSVKEKKLNHDYDFLKLNEPNDPVFSCASSKLEVVSNNEMGRHILAAKDIQVGEVLVEEDPYFTLLLKSQFLFVCSYCLSRRFNLLPCKTCCFSLYCCEACREDAWQSYHNIECSLMATLIDMEFTKLELLGLRTVIKARSDHSNWDALFKTINDAEKNVNSKYRGCIQVNDKWLYNSKHYASIHMLESNVSKRSVSDIFLKSVTAAVFLWLLKNHSNFLSNDDEKQDELIMKCVAGLLLHHIMTSPTNMHGISTNLENAEGKFVDTLNIASAPYPFLSLINHSCAPNVVRSNKLGTALKTLIALRPIKKGMQLFDNYGSHHALEDRATRQENLKFQYRFTCLCEACINDWPTYLRLRPAKNLPKAIKTLKDKVLGIKTINKLEKGDKDTAGAVFKPLCELAELLEPYAPCVEVADCQESLKQCLEILYGQLPRGFSNTVKWSAKQPKILLPAKDA